MDKRIEDKDIRMERGFDGHGMKGAAHLQCREPRGGFDGERESELIGSEAATMQHLGKQKKSNQRVRAGSVSTDEGVPRVEIWLGNLIEHPAGIEEVRMKRERVGSEEPGGAVKVGEEGEAEHGSMDLLDPCCVDGFIAIQKSKGGMLPETMAGGAGGGKARDLEGMHFI